MTKFEEELYNKVKVTNIELTTEAEYKKSTLINHFKNWHSDEEFQELKEGYSNQADSILLMLEEIGSLKSQLQQQAMPVVPECVAEWIEYVKGKNNNALALLDDDNMPDDVNEWLFFQRNDDNINLILRAWLDGYTVEKPQLFYLKHIDFCKTDKHYDWFTIKHSDGPLNHLRVEKGEKPSTIDCKFTQQEINSMQTGSYELVPVEDGE